MLVVFQRNGHQQIHGWMEIPKWGDFLKGGGEDEGLGR